MIETIRNRAMTFGSCQPISSKWWCSGAILNTRLPVQLEGRDLDDDRGRFEHEDAADQHQQHLLLDQDRHGAERAAEGQRADVAHEDLGGVSVVPEKAEARADQRAAEDGQLGRRREAHQQQVLGEDTMPGDVRQSGQRRRPTPRRC